MTKLKKKVKKPKKMRLPKSAIFKSEELIRLSNGIKCTRKGFVFMWHDKQLPGLTHPTKGYLKPKYYPDFDQNKTTRVPSTTTASKGVPLTTNDFVVSGDSSRKHKQTLAQKMKTGRAKGNLLTKQLALFVTLVQEHNIPISEFSVVTRQKRKPQVVTTAWMNKRYPHLTEPDVIKNSISLLNSKAIHLQMLAQKLIGLGLDPIAYELPVASPGRFGTGLDLLCIHMRTGLYVPIELKTGTDSYYLDHDGYLKPPFQSFTSCTLHHYFLQTAATTQAFKQTYPSLASKTTVSLLIRVSKHGAFHYCLPKAFSCM
jgi:hypothetical protein